jgi:cytochrome b6-f complex iron-sulfur subunit
MADKINRRDFLAVCGAGCALLTSGCIAEVYGGDGTFSLTEQPFTVLEDVGGTAPINVGDRAVLLVRASDTEIVALDRICTHSSCDLSSDGMYDVDAGQLICKCHWGIYNLDGEVLSGPPPRPLKKFVVEFDRAGGTGKVIV